MSPEELAIIETALQLAVGQGIIPDSQAESIMRKLLNRPPVTPAERAQEAAWLDSLAPTDAQRAQWHANIDGQGDCDAAA